MQYGRCASSGLRELEDIVGAGNLSTGQSALRLASRDESYYTPFFSPDVVVMPASTDEVSAILKMANPLRIPVTARGAGTSIEGNPVPLYGGIVLDMQRFSHVVEVRPADFVAVVEPGVGYKDLNNAVGRDGLTLAITPFLQDFSMLLLAGFVGGMSWI